MIKQNSVPKKYNKKLPSLTTIKNVLLERIKSNFDAFPTNSQFLEMYFQVSYLPCLQDFINPTLLIQQEDFTIIKYNDCMFFGIAQVAIKCGVGVLIYKDGRIYEGDFNNDQQNGIGFQYFPNGEMYLGQFTNGKYHHFGQFIYEDGSSYEGEWLQNKRHGNGVWKDKDQVYSGNWNKGQIDGYGTMVFENQDRYEGIFVNGKKEGKGCLVYKNGDKYIGQWKNNCFHGQGTYYWCNGATYTGDFQNGVRHGQGVMTKEDEIYQGQFKNDLKHGFGEYQWQDGWYKGEFKKDKRDGQGQIFFQDMFYEGNWIQGKLQTNDIIIEENEDGNYLIQKPEKLKSKSLFKKDKFRSNSVEEEIRKVSHSQKQNEKMVWDLDQTEICEGIVENKVKLPLISKKEERKLKELLITSLGITQSHRKQSNHFMNVYKVKQKKWKGWIPSI